MVPGGWGVLYDAALDEVPRRAVAPGIDFSLLARMTMILMDECLTLREAYGVPIML